MKLWGGRFNKTSDKLAELFNASIQFDARLAKADIQGSLAHVSMLGHCNILAAEDVTHIKNGLKSILKRIHAEEIQWRIADEDIHMNVERLLHEEIGDIAGKLHTARSRNDQVALDLHLYLRTELLQILSLITRLQKTLITVAGQHIDTLLPGYTHLQRAQPVRLAHHLLAYISMLQRDAERLIDSWPRINTLPLGSGALAGSSYPIDRKYTATLLNFDHVYDNSMDAVSDRDFVVEFLAQASICMMHLSRLSEELILWSSYEFNFIELDDAYCTGSSMLPHKKNPDIPELVRAKTGRVYGALVGLLTVLKALPLCYNKDLQEDKEGLFDTIDTLKASLELMSPLISSMSINTHNMYAAVENDHTCAIQIANWLTRKGIPFREAHYISGKIIQYCINNNTTLKSLPLDQYQLFYPGFDATVYQELTPVECVESCTATGGTAAHAVQLQLTLAENQLNTTRHWLDKKNEHIFFDIESL